MSVMNKMKYPDQNILKDLNPLELTVLAVRLSFMKIHQAPRGKQNVLHANLVMVPADIGTTVSQLPRLTSQAAPIKATLKHRLRYKHHVYCLNIRPELVGNTAKYLSEQALYKEHILFNDIWDIVHEPELSENLPRDLENDDQIKSYVNHDSSEKEMFTSHNYRVFYSKVNHTTQQKHSNTESEEAVEMIDKTSLR